MIITMINEQSKKDLVGYIQKTLWSSVILLSLILVVMAMAAFSHLYEMMDALLGALLGIVLTTANLFSLGYAFFVIAINNGRKMMVLWPLATFLIMSGAALVLSIYFPAYLLGFALGLTAPVVFGVAIVFSPS
jgi:hypothetical protein